MGIVKSTARLLRNKQTKSEAKVWELLRNRQMDGYKFYRQHPIQFKYNGRWRFFTADFYCAELKLVLEIDGKIHEQQKDYDDLRTFIINQMGIRVVRIKNELTQDPDTFMQQIKNYL